MDINTNMNALSRTPENTNLLQPTKFILTFDRLGSAQFFCQGVNVPGLNLGQALINFPGQDVYAPGTKVTFNPLAIHFILDEELASWRAIYNWFMAIADPQGTEAAMQQSDLQNRFKFNPRSALKNYSDATLTVLSALNNPLFRIKFHNVFPITLSDIPLDTTQSAEDILTGDATFVFDYFTFEDIK
jgi:hypothetical protein